jgi:AcrR family transcriptional regulator
MDGEPVVLCSNGSMVQLVEEIEAPRRGRPRRFSSHTERQLLLDASVRVMSENGYDGTSVNDILEEAGLSTRAFYRQFDSKQALLTALIERERDRVAHHLEQAAKSADGPLAAVEAWIDAFLDLLYNPEIAPTTAIFTAPSVMASYTLATSLPEMQRMFCPPLIKALRAGHRAGVLKSPAPEADAYCIHALVHASLDVHHRARLPKRAVVKAQILRFAWPALGLRLKRS